MAISAITHPAKNAGQRSIDHYIGSQAFIAAARIGHLCVAEVEENEHGQRMPTGRKLFANPKNNPHPRMPTIAYRIEEVDLGKDSAGKEIKPSHVVWEGIVDMTADEALAAAAPVKQRDQASGPAVFLLDILANGPVLVSVIEQRAAARGFSTKRTSPVCRAPC